MEKLEIFIRVSCQFFVVNGPIFEEIFGGDVKMTFYMMLMLSYDCHMTVTYSCHTVEVLACSCL